MSKKETFVAKIEELPAILAFVRKVLMGLPLSSTEKGRIELITEEATMNIIQHGHSDCILQITLEFRYQPNRMIELDIIDNSTPFNPLLHPETEMPPKEPGGLGVSMMRNFADTLLYRRDGDQNVLTLIKNL